MADTAINIEFTKDVWESFFDPETIESLGLPKAVAETKRGFSMRTFVAVDPAVAEGVYAYILEEIRFGEGAEERSILIDRKAMAQAKGLYERIEQLTITNKEDG